MTGLTALVYGSSQIPSLAGWGGLMGGGAVILLLLSGNLRAIQNTRFLIQNFSHITGSSHTPAYRL